MKLFYSALVSCCLVSLASCGLKSPGSGGPPPAQKYSIGAALRYLSKAIFTDALAGGVFKLTRLKKTFIKCGR